MNDRYLRQTVLPEVGAAGQSRLAAATVLVVGAGGLGAIALPLLAGAGVGRLVVMDHDRVELTNLHRQPLYRMDDIGRPKAEAARTALAAYNPDVAVEARVERLGPGNAAAAVAAADLVLDATDRLVVTYMLSDACLAAGKPLVAASVIEQRGLVGGFCGAAPSYRAVFPDMPSSVGSCAENGVLGPAVGVIGSLQAQMALQVLLGATPSPLGRLVTVSLADMAFGGFRFDGAPEPAEPPVGFVAPAGVGPMDRVIELRDAEEAPVPALPGAWRLAPECVATADLPEDGSLVFACASGVRAYRAAREAQRRGARDVAVLVPE